MLNKKRLAILSLLGIAGMIFLVSCKVSKDYQGEWFALDSSGKQVKLMYTETELEISGDGKYSLSQYGIGVENNVKYYQVKIDNIKYTLIYPDKKDMDTAVLIMPNNGEKPLDGNIIFKMSRNEFPK